MYYVTFNNRKKWHSCRDLTLEKVKIFATMHPDARPNIPIYIGERNARNKPVRPIMVGERNTRRYVWFHVEFTDAALTGESRI